MSDYISKSAVIKLIESKMTDGCLGTEDDTFIGGHGLVDDISDLPTLDEKEIIRKVFERVMERLEERKDHIMKEFVLTDKAKEVKSDSLNRINELDGTIEILKEECGINE